MRSRCCGSSSRRIRKIYRVKEHFFRPGEGVRAFAQGRSRQAECRDSVTVARSVSVSSGRRKVRFGYRLKNGSRRIASFLFGVELNFSLLDAHFNRLGEAAGLLRFALVDPLKRQEVAVAFNRPARLWYFPREARVKTSKGEKRVYQGVRLACLWRVRLPPGRLWAVQGEMGVRVLDAHE